MERRPNIIFIILGMMFITSCNKEDVSPSKCHPVNLVIMPANLSPNYVEIFINPSQLPDMPAWRSWANMITLSQIRSFDNRDDNEEYCGASMVVKTIVTNGRTNRFVKDYETTISWSQGDTLIVTPDSTYIKH